mgnify:FL=1
MQNYERQMPEERKALHMAVVEILALDKMNILKLAKLLDIDRGKVYRMLKGEDVDQLPQRWSKFEDDYILANYLNKTYKQIAKDLNRTYSGISYRRRALGVSKKINYPWPVQQVADESEPF